MASLVLSLILAVMGMQRGQRGALPFSDNPPPPPPAAVGTESIAGIVLQGETQRPLARVRVELRREDYATQLSGRERACNPSRDVEDPSLRRFAMTDEYGRFNFQNIAPGRYYVLAEHEGYLRAEFGQRDGSFPRGMLLEIGPQVDLQSPGTPSARGGPVASTRPGMSNTFLHELTLRLHPAPTLIGRVYNEEGARVPAAIVQLYQYRFAPMGPYFKPIRSIFTDDNGEYRLFWLNPGRYVVAAAYSDYVLQPWLESIRFTPNLPDGDNRYPVVFYPGVTKASEAIPVTVGAVAASPTDIALWKRDRFSVTIKLVGAPAPKNTRVVLVPLGGDLCAAADFALGPRRDGIAEIRDVPKGSYLVMAMDGRDSLSELRPLDVDQHIRNYELPLVAPVEIGVRSNIEGARITLTRTGNEVSHAVNAERNAAGRLVFKGVGPGSYYVTADSPPGYYVSSVIAYRLEPENPFDPCTPLPRTNPRTLNTPNYRYLDSHRHLDRNTPLVVPGVVPGEARCISVTFAYASRIFGRAIDRLGAPVAGALAVGLPRSLWGESDSKVAFTPHDGYLTTTTDREGRFVLMGAVPNMEYKLFAFEDLDTNLVYDPDLLTAFAGRDLIDIQEGAGDAPGVSRNQRGDAVRSVTGAECSTNTECRVTAIPARETRELNMGR